MSAFAAVFPGQGSQAVGMLADLAEQEPVVRETFDEAGEALGRDLPAAVGGVPVFDLVLLGLGPDGHVASLFPGTRALTASQAATAVYVPKLDAWRLSLSLPVLNAARRVWLLASGGDKAVVVRQALGESGDDPLPVQRLAPRGDWAWYLDAAAAEGVASDPGS